MEKKKKIWLIVLIASLAFALLMFALVVILIVVLFASKSKYDSLANTNVTVEEPMESNEKKQPESEEIIAESEYEESGEEGKEGKEESGISTDVEFDTTESENNGSTTVIYNGVTYYREYTFDNIEKQALWGEFSQYKGACEVVGLDEFGEEVTRFRDYGYGDMYFYNRRMYSQKIDEDTGARCMYSCDLVGGEVIEYGEGWWKAIDAKNGVLYRTTNSAFEAFYPDSESYDVVESAGCEVYGVDEGMVFYGRTAPDASECFSIYRYDPVQKSSISLAMLDPTYDIGNDYESNYYLVENVILHNQMVYFSYGGYSGSGNFYDGGIIGRAAYDGSYWESLAIVGYISPDYYLYSDSDCEAIYYLSQDEELVTSVISGEGAPNDIEPHGVQELPYYDSASNEVCIQDGFDGSALVLLTSEEIEGLGVTKYYEDSDGELSFYLSDMEKVGDALYFTVLCGSHNATADIGWRMSYDLDIFRRYKKDVTTGELTCLYSND